MKRAWQTVTGYRQMQQSVMDAAAAASAAALLVLVLACGVGVDGLAVPPVEEEAEAAAALGAASEADEAEAGVPASGVAPRARSWARAAVLLRDDESSQSQKRVGRSSQKGRRERARRRT